MKHSDSCASQPPNFWLCDCQLETLPCDADLLGGSSRCTLEEGHIGWHQEWEEEDGELILHVTWKYSRKEERICGGRDPMYPGQACQLPKDHWRIPGREDCEFKESLYRGLDFWEK